MHYLELPQHFKSKTPCAVPLESVVQAAITLLTALIQIRLVDYFPSFGAKKKKKKKKKEGMLMRTRQAVYV